MVLEIMGAALFSIGGGALVVFALSKWLGGVWANRILENERASLAREHELLVRRRNVYTKLALTMRVFIRSDAGASEDQKSDFLAAYDEAALWAAENVANEMNRLIDLQVKHVAQPGSVSPQELKELFIRVITEMRKDCGFPETGYEHRIVNF